jgi:hypothetical protein
MGEDGAHHMAHHFLAVSFFVYLLILMSVLEDLEQTMVVGLAQKTMH